MCGIAHVAIDGQRVLRRQVARPVDRPHGVVEIVRRSDGGFEDGPEHADRRAQPEIRLVEQGLVAGKWTPPRPGATSARRAGRNSSARTGSMPRAQVAKSQEGHRIFLFTRHRWGPDRGTKYRVRSTERPAQVCQRDISGHPGGRSGCVPTGRHRKRSPARRRTRTPGVPAGNENCTVVGTLVTGLMTTISCVPALGWNERANWPSVRGGAAAGSSGGAGTRSRGCGDETTTPAGGQSLR